MHDWLAPFARSLSVPGYPFLRALSVPVGVFSDEEMELGGGEPEENAIMDVFSSLDLDPPSSEGGELTFSAFLRREREFAREENLRPINQLLAIPISHYPPLGTLRTKIIYVQTGKVGFLKKKLVHLALQALLSACRSQVRDSEEDWVEVQRAIIEDVGGGDPLFSDDFPWSLDEVEPGELERYGESFPGLRCSIRPGFYRPESSGTSLLESLLDPDPPWEGDLSPSQFVQDPSQSLSTLRESETQVRGDDEVVSGDDSAPHTIHSSLVPETPLDGVD
jgi:hypothetical protein